MASVVFARAATKNAEPLACAQTNESFEIVTGLTHLYFSSPDVQALSNETGEPGYWAYPHLVVVSQEFLEN